MKKKYTKCECCPYYAKDSETNKWGCSKINKTFLSFSNSTYGEPKHLDTKGVCIFNKGTMDSGDLEMANTILERWIRANKESE